MEHPIEALHRRGEGRGFGEVTADEFDPKGREGRRLDRIPDESDHGGTVLPNLPRQGAADEAGGAGEKVPQTHDGSGR